MAGRLTRFLNLERARKPSDTPHHGVVTKERFAGERKAQLESGGEMQRGGYRDPTPIGFRLLKVIPDGRVRFAVGSIFAGGFVGALVVAFRYRHIDQSVEGLALLVAFLLVSVFLPNPRRRRWWDGD